jgi:hypothetical protein
MQRRTAYLIITLQMAAICEELIRNPRLTDKVDLSRYRTLHPDGRRLVSGWFQRAWEARNCTPANNFEPFIFAFIALNAWASCVTTFDRDRDWRDALSLDQTLSDDFSRLVDDPSSPVGGPADELRRLWPVLEVQSLRQLRIGPGMSGGKRQEIVNRYLGHPRAGRLRFEPRCWKRHRDTDEEVPLDWPHTLAVLYRVRCNRFHGEKARHSEMDQRIVYLAFCVLVGFFGDTGYLLY